MLATRLVHSRLNYCNAVFSGLSACDIWRLQSVLNLFVRLDAGARKYDHGTSLLRDRHWLQIAERIEYKLCTLVYRCLQGNAPRYLADHVERTSSRRSKERLVICGHFHSGSAENSSIVWRQSFLSRRPVRLEQSSHKCLLYPVNVLFKKTFKSVFIPACAFLT